MKEILFYSLNFCLFIYQLTNGSTQTECLNLFDNLFISPFILEKAYSKTLIKPFKLKSMEYGMFELDELGIWYIKDLNELLKYRLYVHSGLIYDSLGYPFNTLEQKSIYVMDIEGNIFVESNNTGIVKHHSAFFDGNPVASAGSIIIIQGKIIFLDNRSGHYQPSKNFLTQLVQRFQELGVDLKNTTIEYN